MADPLPRRRRLRRLLLILSVLAAVAIGGDTLLWRWAVQGLDDGFQNWVAATRADGWAVSAGSRSRGGWPFDARLSVADLHLGGTLPGSGDRLAWSAERTTLALDPVSPHTLTIAADGRQTIAAGAAPPLPYTADSLTLTVPLQPDLPAQSGQLRGANIRFDNGASIAGLAAQGAFQPGADRGRPEFDFNLTAEAIGLPAAAAGVARALGPRLASVFVQGALTGPWPRTPDVSARAAGWRDGGGTLDIRRLTVGWGPLGLSGSATLALDAKLQPVGSGTAKLIGEAEALDALARAHVLTGSAALAAKAVLGMLQHTPSGGGAPEVDVPLTLQDRTVMMGSIPLAKLPEVAWPG